MRQTLRSLIGIILKREVNLSSLSFHFRLNASIVMLFFYHHQKVIDHVLANHPFCYYYCDTTCTEFDNIIKHSVKNHSLDVLKIKHLELNEKNGIYSYRSHNFNIIPIELDSTGKKIETDSTLDAWKIHIVLDKSSDVLIAYKVKQYLVSTILLVTKF